MDKPTDITTITFQEFFNTYSKEEAKKKLWDLLYTAFSCESPNQWDSNTRSEYLYFYKKMDELIDISYQEAHTNTNQ